MTPHGSFIWADLSSFRPATTRAFYTSLLGWRFDGNDYAIATAQGRPIAGSFEMPAFFQKIRMPSFWMSYMQVDNVETAMEIATAQGGKVELGPEPFDGGGRIALIRDPLGAGFTVYEGSALPADQNTGRQHGLFVSDAAAVMPFYTALFGWIFGSDKDGTRTITNGDTQIAHLHEIPDPALRGTEEYWAVMVPATAKSLAQIDSLGGKIEAQFDVPEGPVTVIHDPDGAALFLLTDGDVTTAATSAPWPWRGWLGLALIALAVGTGWGWINAVFLAVWIALGLRDRATYLFEPIERDRQPTLYWLVLASFAGLAVLSILYTTAF